MAYNNPLNVPSIRAEHIYSNANLELYPTGYTTVANGIGFNLRAVGVTGDITSADTIVMATGLVAGIVLTLPAIADVSSGFTLFIKDQDGTAATNSITVDGDGAETVDGAANYVMSSPFESVTLCANGTGWSIL